MYTIIYRFFLLTACFQALMPLNANQMQNLESRINRLVLVRIHCFSYQLQIRTIRCYRVLFGLKSGFFLLQVAHAHTHARTAAKMRDTCEGERAHC